MGSMYMSEQLLTDNLLSTGYKKFWAVDGQGQTTRESRRPTRVGWPVRKREKRPSSFHDSRLVSVHATPDNSTTQPLYQNSSDMVSTTGFARLDTGTLSTIGWSSGADNPDKERDEKDELYKLTKVEFKRLQEQVRDVSMNLRNRFRTSAYQFPNEKNTEKLYQRPNGENANQVYRTQLAASLKAFQQKQWPPLNHQELDPTFLRCKPVVPGHERPTSSHPSRAGTPTRPQRPKSVPASALRNRSALRRSETPSDVHPGSYDTLSPAVLKRFMENFERPSSAEDKSPLIDVLTEETRRLTERDEDACTTSGIDSAGSDTESPELSEDSDFEPDVTSTDMQLPPELNLRPEKLDAIYVPEPRRGWRQFDFDMENVELPPYEFQSPFPDYLDDLDLKQAAKSKKNWRTQVKIKSKEDMLEGVLDRLVELEKLQMDTVEWENKRALQLRKATIKPRTSSAKLKDKKCDPQCLQATCFGDCPEKLVQSPTCEFCRQSFCTGTCKETKYEQRMRQPRVEDVPPPPPRSLHPKACTSCQKRHNAKYINANNLLLGQARINNATYNRGQTALKVKDLRPKSETILPSEVVKEFEKLGLDTTQPSRPSTAMSMSRPKSRSSLVPGKSFNSQRRDSLTDTDKAVGSKKKKTRSAKYRRPKTAT